jgi:hypothetical protein
MLDDRRAQRLREAEPAELCSQDLPQMGSEIGGIHPQEMHNIWQLQWENDAKPLDFRILGVCILFSDKFICPFLL